MNNENGEHRIPTVQSLPRSTTRGYNRTPPNAGYNYARRTETLVAFTSAKTLSPGMRCISWTERVVIIDAISPMLVSTITSLMTLSDTMLFTFPGSWFRMLSSIRGEDSANRTRCQLAAVASEATVGASGYSEDAQKFFKSVPVTSKAR